MTRLWINLSCWSNYNFCECSCE